MRKHIDIVEDFLHSYFAREQQRVIDLVTDDFTWLNMALPKASLHGRDALAAKLILPNLGLPIELEEAGHETLASLEDGDLLMHERIDRMRFRGEWLEVPCAAVFRLCEGRIAVWKDYYDIGGVIRFMARIGTPLDTSGWF